MRDYRKRRTILDRERVFDLYGNKCACCGITESFFLTLDHINNDGQIDRKKGWTTTESYRRILTGEWVDRFRLMCWNCNRARWICGECPHVIRARGETPTYLAYETLSRERITANDARVSATSTQQS